MAAWLPAVKTILPYVTQIVAAAVPAFTQKTDKDGTEEAVSGQIAELQAAVVHNAESLKILATQLQQVVNGLDAGSSRMEADIKTVKRLSVAAIATSTLAIVLWLAAWFSGH